MTDRMPSENERSVKNSWEIENLKDNERILKEDIVRLGERVTTEIKEVNINFSNEINATRDSLRKETKEALSEANSNIKALEKRVSELDVWKEKIGNEVKALFRIVDSLKESDLWLKRTITGSIIGALITAAFSIVIFFIKN